MPEFVPWDNACFKVESGLMLKIVKEGHSRVVISPLYRICKRLKLIIWTLKQMTCN